MEREYLSPILNQTYKIWPFIQVFVMKNRYLKPSKKIMAQRQRAVDLSSVKMVLDHWSFSSSKLQQANGTVQTYKMLFFLAFLCLCCFKKNVQMYAIVSTQFPCGLIFVVINSPLILQQRIIILCTSPRKNWRRKIYITLINLVVFSFEAHNFTKKATNNCDDENV